MSDETERLVDRYGQARAIGGVIGSRDARFALLAHIRAIERERDELQSTFDLRWKADLRAIERWREATGKELVIPDRSDLCVWLLERIAALEEDLNRVTRGTWSKEIARQSALLAYIERIERERDEEKAIVDRIWDMLGRPSYEELAGRSIYDLIRAKDEHADVLNAAIRKLQDEQWDAHERIASLEDEVCAKDERTEALERERDHYKNDALGCLLRIASLEAEVERYENSTRCPVCDTWRILAYAAEAEVERLRADAERYEYLRNPHNETYFLYQKDGFGGVELMSGPSLDDAIDEARKP